MNKRSKKKLKRKVRKQEYLDHFVEFVYNRILLKGTEEDVNAVWCIKAIRAYTQLGLKEAKDIFDRLRSPFGHTEYITVKPEDYNAAYRELRKVGFRL